ncbi:MAG: histidinol dehydrogenase [Armatimonadetes bacterium CG07_land_8_20_14_0_80_40_9]|nr:MAG: histidinol dehydrogenase [Armatimonadetes bacterium CG07_land_8_20_14_0_80_40_9]
MPSYRHDYIGHKCPPTGWTVDYGLNKGGKKIRKEEIVTSKIIEEVKRKKDEALLKYTEQFDGVRLSLKDLTVTKEEIRLALKEVDQDFLIALGRAKRNIERFHKRELFKKDIRIKDKSYFVGQITQPLERVGIYIPGGLASYPSTVLMTAIPAKIAGVKRIVMVTPPNKEGKVNSFTLAAAREVGINKIFKVGGAQAIAALAFGTKTIPKVDKIVGPGNTYVTLAKKLVYGYVGIDSLAGPTELVILADGRANGAFIAADLLSQAEHSPQAKLALITTSKELAQKVEAEIKEQIKSLLRKSIIQRSLKKKKVILVKSLNQGVEIINRMAPEHLELQVKNPAFFLRKIKNAGAIFLGDYSPTALGDYFAGPSHVLPTGTTARFFSPLSVDDFLKKSSVISYRREDLNKAKKTIIKLAEVEGLDGHIQAIKVRSKK